MNTVAASANDTPCLRRFVAVERVIGFKRGAGGTGGVSYPVFAQDARRGAASGDMEIGDGFVSL